MQAEAAPGPEWASQLRAQLASLGREAARVAGTKPEDLPAPELAAAGDQDGLLQKVVYLCEEDALQRSALAAQVGCFGFRVVSFEDPEQLYQAVQVARPDAILTDLTFPGRPTGGAETVARIHSEREAPIPAVFFSAQNDFSFRLCAVRAGASAYFVKPVNGTDLCATLTALTRELQSEPYRILIVDDEPHQLAMYAAILQGEGMVTLELSDPLQVMSHLGEFNPDLILTDMHMPGCDGMELAKTIRQTGPAFSVPIVFLSGETDTDLQFHAMRMGGDEFLVKPIKPEHLISAVAVRAERMKVIRSFMVRDSMTGLFNHSALMDRLDSLLAETRRRGGDLCYAMIDIDKFKLINDSYGHQTGDRVLISLAKFLRHRLRKTDVVGRYGGEEFAVVLTDCNLATATSLLEKLRESFAEIRFSAGELSFCSTFSCGIAAFSGRQSAEQLCQAADRALYAAKNAGRNRVVAAVGDERQ